MRIRLLITLILICFAGQLLAQNVTVIDKVDRHPLPYISIFALPDPSAVFVTDAKGQVDISALINQEQIVFRLTGYKELNFSYQELETQDFKLSMEETLISLDEMVISANRWEQDSREIPVHIAKIKPAEVLLQNPQTAADMLAISGEVYIQKSQLGGGSPMIRGFSTNRLLIAVDGVRMNNAIFRTGNMQNVISIDPFTLEETEVLFGPGSVMYGSDAIGGVMDFHLLTPQVTGNADGSYLSGNGVMRYATANNEKTAHLDLSYGKGQWGFTTSATFSDFGDMVMGSNGLDDYLRPELVQRINGEDQV
ncbi:MAG: TonB-dependent receptor plug domain-containing protein, partial [Bacteroidota bacterium]